MFKLFRKIRRELLDELNIKKYLIYAIGEILLVMIGILLAIKVNNLNELELDQKKEIQFYQNFKRQIAEDKQIITRNKSYNLNYKSQFQYAIQIIEENDREKVDTLGYICLNLTKYSDFDRSGNLYESIINSGQLELLTNDEIIESIQILEETYNYMNRMEEIHYDFVKAIVPGLIDIIKYSNHEIQQPDEIYNYKFQNIFINADNVMREKDEVYDRALRQILVITKLINSELNKH